MQTREHEPIKARVLWWNDGQGFGFLKAGTKDIFANHTVISCEGFKTLQPGEFVVASLARTPSVSAFVAESVMRFHDENEVDRFLATIEPTANEEITNEAQYA